MLICGSILSSFLEPHSYASAGLFTGDWLKSTLIAVFPAFYHCASATSPMVALDDFRCPVGSHQFDSGHAADNSYLLIFLSSQTHTVCPRRYPDVIGADTLFLRTENCKLSLQQQRNNLYGSLKFHRFCSVFPSANPKGTAGGMEFPPRPRTRQVRAGM